LALFAAALESIRRDRKRVAALEAEQKRQREEAVFERASQVSAWPEDWSSNDVRVMCHNGCSEPIYDVVLRIADGNSVLPPSASHHEDTKSAFLIRPGENLETVLRRSSSYLGQPRVDMAFRDTRGCRWWRRTDGAIALVSYAEPQIKIRGSGLDDENNN
jgi:hypothetical protein